MIGSGRATARANGRGAKQYGDTIAASASAMTPNPASVRAGPLPTSSQR